MCIRPPHYGASDAIWLEVSVLASDQVATVMPHPSPAMEQPTYAIILIVAKEPDMRAYMRGGLRLLKGPVGPVFEAADGEVALEIARYLVPSLIISEVHLPKMNGFMLCRALQSDVALRHIPVLLISSETSIKVVREQAGKAGASGFLSKPFNARQLCAELESLLRFSHV